MLIVAILIIVLIIIPILYSHMKVDISNYEITNKKIDKNIKIVQLSDLHNRNISKKISKIINDINPDIIIMSGDMINESMDEINNFLSLLDKIDNKKVYYTFGNHELRLKELEDYKKIIKKTSINVLNNEHISLSKNVELYGLNVDLKYYDEGFEFNEEEIKNTFLEIDKNKFNILVAHNPLWAKVYSKFNFHLTLSGHVHGGVIKLPLLGGLLSPEFSFFPKYFQGKYIINKMEMIVSRGLGYCTKLRFRYLNPAEIVIINLNKEE